MKDQPARLVLSSILAFPTRPDVRSNDSSLRAFQPQDPTSFAVKLQVFVGETEGGTVDSFDVDLCTPTWLAQHFDSYSQHRTLAGGLVVPGGGLWLIERWDADTVEATIRRLLSAATAPGWKDLANWLGRYIPWEFHYKYDREQGVSVDIDTLYPKPTDA